MSTKELTLLRHIQHGFQIYNSVDINDREHKIPTSNNVVQITGYEDFRIFYARMSSAHGIFL